MKVAGPQLAAAEEALARVLTMQQPADAVLARYFHDDSRLGRNDRAFIAETVFGVLRRRYGLEHQTRAQSARELLLAYLNRIQGISLRRLEPWLTAADMTWASAIRVPDAPPPLHVAAELPEWLVSMLKAELPDGEILALGRALQQAAPLDLRVNSLRASRDEVLRQLELEGITAHATPYSPHGVRLGEKPAINRHPLFVAGTIEVQDEGSQLVCHLLAPRRRDLVVDFCAGAGGKTLALGSMMQSLGRLYAYDVSEPRLAKLRPRLKRSGLSNVHPQLLRNENDIKVKRLAGKIDRVLVDAPCSGFGTLRRNPDLKWRQHEADISEVTAKQRSILTAAAALLKPGGRLVYATCSFLRAENEDVIDAFLARHTDFAVVPANEVLHGQRIALDTGRFLQLYPHRHGCDGFFAAALERRSR